MCVCVYFKNASTAICHSTSASAIQRKAQALSLSSSSSWSWSWNVARLYKEGLLQRSFSCSSDLLVGQSSSAVQCVW